MRERPSPAFLLRLLAPEDRSMVVIASGCARSLSDIASPPGADRPYDARRIATSQ
jgi:hypothetical protein